MSTRKAPTTWPDRSLTGGPGNYDTTNQSSDVPDHRLNLLIDGGVTTGTGKAPTRA